LWLGWPVKTDCRYQPAAFRGARDLEIQNPVKSHDHAEAGERRRARIRRTAYVERARGELDDTSRYLRPSLQPGRPIPKSWP
jgi:hypothetical protein